MTREVQQDLPYATGQRQWIEDIRALHIKSLPAKMLLLMIHSHIPPDRSYWDMQPSELWKECGISNPTYYRAVALLTSLGLLSVEPGLWQYRRRYRLIRSAISEAAQECRKDRSYILKSERSEPEHERSEAAHISSESCDGISSQRDSISSQRDSISSQRDSISSQRSFTLLTNNKETDLQQRATEDALADELVDCWNRLMSAHCAMTAKRRKSLRARWREPWWRLHWQEALERASRSAFCRGKKGWRADLEWFLQPDSARKLLEGKYDDRPEDDLYAGIRAFESRMHRQRE